jgi:hypothetical protein
VKEQDEQAGRDGAGRLDGYVEHAGPRRIASLERPTPVEDVAIYGANRESERCRRYVRRPDRQQQPVSDKAECRVRYADKQETCELAQGVISRDDAVQPCVIQYWPGDRN